MCGSQRCSLPVCALPMETVNHFTAMGQHITSIRLFNTISTECTDRLSLLTKAAAIALLVDWMIDRKSTGNYFVD